MACCTATTSSTLRTKTSRRSVGGTQPSTVVASPILDSTRLEAGREGGRPHRASWASPRDDSQPPVHVRGGLSRGRPTRPVGRLGAVVRPADPSFWGSAARPGRAAPPSRRCDVRPGDARRLAPPSAARLCCSAVFFVVRTKNAGRFQQLPGPASVLLCGPRPQRAPQTRDKDAARLSAGALVWGARREVRGISRRPFSRLRQRLQGAKTPP